GDESARLALEQEGGRGQREDPTLAVPVLQGHGALLVADHRAAEAALGVLDHQAVLGRHRRSLAPAPSPASRSAGQHVSAGLPAPHGISSARIPQPGRGRSRTCGQRTQRIPAGTPPTRAIAAGAGRATILLWAITRAAFPRDGPG